MLDFQKLTLIQTWLVWFPEIDQLFSKVHNKEVKEDDFDVDEELKKPTIAKQGDIWYLGRSTVWFSKLYLTRDLPHC